MSNISICEHRLKGHELYEEEGRTMCKTCNKMIDDQSIKDRAYYGTIRLLNNYIKYNFIPKFNNNVNNGDWTFIWSCLFGSMIPFIGLIFPLIPFLLDYDSHLSKEVKIIFHWGILITVISTLIFISLS